MPLYDTLGEAAVLHALDHADVRLAVPSLGAAADCMQALIALALCFEIASARIVSVLLLASRVCGEANAEHMLCRVHLLPELVGMSAGPEKHPLRLSVDMWPLGTWPR